MEQQNSQALPPIPDRRYFSIGEASALCAVKPHVLRYWEQEFRQLCPNKRRGNRRYYRRKDVDMIRRIRALLYDEGFTINGARAKLVGQAATVEVQPQQSSEQQRQELQKTIGELEEILKVLEGVGRISVA